MKERGRRSAISSLLELLGILEEDEVEHNLPI